MICEKVLRNLSPFLDNMLEEGQSEKVSRHLDTCPKCSRELERLRNLQSQLRGLDPRGAPDCLRTLVHQRIRNARAASWQQSLISEIAYYWSRVRTTEGKWYVIRLAGSLATVALFIMISGSIKPVYLKLDDELAARGNIRAARMLVTNLQRVFGSPPEAQKKPIRSSEPKINDEYLANFAVSVSRTAQEDTVSVVTTVDSNGAAKVKDILEYPADDSLLSGWTDMINSAAWRPASQNGRAVNSSLVMTYTQIYVYN